MGGNVIEITSKAQWHQILEDAKKDNKLVVVDFSATWCGPCRIISPIFEQLSTKYENAVFVKVDVDSVEEVATECNISAMPTFHCYKDGEKVDELVGAAKEKLQLMLKNHLES